MAEEEKSGGGAPLSMSEPVACGGGREGEDIPTVVYTVLVDGTPCTTVDLPETATLVVAREKIMFEAEEFTEEMPQDGQFLFLFHGLQCSKRKERTRFVRDATGPDARLHIVSRMKRNDTSPTTNDTPQKAPPPPQASSVPPPPKIDSTGKQENADGEIYVCHVCDDTTTALANKLISSFQEKGQKTYTEGKAKRRHHEREIVSCDHHGPRCR